MVQFYILHGPMIYAIIIINSCDLYGLPKATRLFPSPFPVSQFQCLAAVTVLCSYQLPTISLSISIRSNCLFALIVIHRIVPLPLCVCVCLGNS